MTPRPEAADDGGVDGHGSRRRVARIVAAVILAAVVLWLLFTLVFPWVERSLSNPTLG